MSQEFTSKNMPSQKRTFGSITRSIVTFTRPVRNVSKSSTTRETPVSKAYLPQGYVPRRVSKHDPMPSDLPEHEQKGVEAGRSVLFSESCVAYGNFEKCLTDRHLCGFSSKNTVLDNS